MNSYIYKTDKDELGYFQIFDGKYYHLPIKTGQNTIEVDTWDQRFAFEKNFSKNPNTFRITKKKTQEELSFILTTQSTDGVVKIKKIKETFDAGSFYPRMNFGEVQLSDKQIDSSEMLDEIRAYENITLSLESLFNSIEPEANNFKTYGNKIRELLIISCTEVEYLLKKLLNAHNIKPKRRFHTTKDYIWSLPILKLNKYALTLPFYPALGTFSPFKKWNPTKPTESIFWYHHYNQVKHDRGSTKNKANLQALINSIAAIHILLDAQYGKEIFCFRFQHSFKTLFITQTRPSWGIDEICTPLLTNRQVEWKNIKHHP